jgi:hypothetical protein
MHMHMHVNDKRGFPVSRFRFPVGGSGKHSALCFHASLGALWDGEGLLKN